MNVYNYKEIKSILKNEYNIKINLARKKIFKLDKGIYSDTKDVDELTILFKKYPGIILTLESAFYYYDLSSIKPNKIIVGTRRNFTRIKNSNVKQVFYSNTKLDDNAIHYIKNGIEVNVFSRERLLVELIRNKNNFSNEYYNEVYYNFLRISDSLDDYLVLEYARFYRNREAEEFAQKYIHYIKTEEDYSYLYIKDKNKEYVRNLRFNKFDEICECCNSKTINMYQYVCYKCGWWNSYSKTIDQNEYSEENASSLNLYRKKYLEELNKNKYYCWSETRNRMGPIKKIVKNTIIDEEKNICACCNGNTINKWYDQCYYCGWIADYVQELDDADCDEKGPNKYALWWYKEDYEEFIESNPNYIYKDNPKIFSDFLERYAEDYLLNDGDIE